MPLKSIAPTISPGFIRRYSSAYPRCHPRWHRGWPVQGRASVAGAAGLAGAGGRWAALDEQLSGIRRSCSPPTKSPWPAYTVRKPDRIRHRSDAERYCSGRSLNSQPENTRRQSPAFQYQQFPDKGPGFLRAFPLRGAFTRAQADDRTADPDTLPASGPAIPASNQGR